MFRFFLAALACGWMVLVSLSSAETQRDYTCFQSAAPYSPALDIGSDMAVVYGMGGNFEARANGWKEQGYAVGMMTGISWGGYDDYYQTPDGFKKEEVQTTRTGRLYMHGNSKTVGYNVPTPDYVEYIKHLVSPAVDWGVQAIFLEEPEYWAETGWSEAFKREWQRFYGEDWEAPDSSVDAQYRASKLKYELYFNALREVIQHIKQRAAAQGRTVECHVPTHSLINYAHWRIVSPESYLMQLEEMDGYIAQVWTGTARTKTIYQGVKKERTFEAAFLEYGQMLGMVRPTGRKVWFLADPIEDNPNYSWNNYKWNYECTLIASLLWPEVHHYEVMPWPDRIFQGTYPKVDMGQTSGEKEGIPAEYATQLLAVLNALNDMEQQEVEYMTGTRGIGIIVSDTMMFQRAAPHPSDPDLGSFYGLAMPLVKAGIPLEPAQLETIATPGAFDRYALLLLSYEGQKPLKPEYHEQLVAWVKAGGLLLFAGDNSDPYHHVREWWNDQGRNAASAQEDLFNRLGVDITAWRAPVPVGNGFVRFVAERPSRLQRYEFGARQVLDWVSELLQQKEIALETRHYLGVRRGPYLVVSVLDESITDAPLTLKGSFVDIFDPMLARREQCVLNPNERTLLYDLDWARKHGLRAGVIAAASSVRDQIIGKGVLHFTMRGPEGTTGRMQIVLPGAPQSIAMEPPIAFEQRWDESARLLWLSYPNIAAPVRVQVEYEESDS